MTESPSHKPSRAEQIDELGQLSIRSQRDGDTYTISLSGEMDLANAADVEQELDRAEATNASVILLDLSRLTFIDSTGIRLLVAADARSRSDSGRLLLKRPPRTVMRVLVIAGIDDRLPFAD
jgi:anti-anti-sigma factor